MGDSLGTPKDLHPDTRLIDACADGDRDAQTALMRRLLPVLKHQVAAVTRRASTRGSGFRREVQDVVQDIFVELLRDGAKELRRWDPSRGLTLEGFARLVARRFATRRIMGRKPEPADPTEPALLEATFGGSTTNTVEHRDELDVILEGLYAQMTPRDEELFRRLFLEEQSPATVTAQMDITPAALKKWRSRLYQKARDVAQKVRSGPTLRDTLVRENRMSPSDGLAPTTTSKAKIEESQ